MSDILGQIVPDMRTEIGERVKAMNRWSLSMCVFFVFCSSSSSSMILCGRQEVKYSIKFIFILVVY